MDSPTTKQPYAVRQRDWHDGLFDCTNDCNSCKLFFYCLFFPFFSKKNLVLQLKCWLVLCCYSCYMCYMYRRYDECWATPCFIICPGLTLRAYHRAKHNIQVSSVKVFYQIINQFLKAIGTLCRDYLKEYFCPLCAACQLDRDMKYVEATSGILNV
ncbi:uncharacterized protein DC041_0001915 [Schistosoma bovis]|uniref:Uncharacterized protein n=1 Tax=Schistosoma bovis TaxID=6184 RepID=A0A430QMN4_SCHBO|nr:uncharacterized protein DC041_0001915 [Schistosoma bovis]